MFLFCLRSLRFSRTIVLFMAYQKHWSPVFTGVTEENIYVYLRSSVVMPFKNTRECPKIASQM
jgi:hypothetical protein